MIWIPDPFYPDRAQAVDVQHFPGSSSRSRFGPAEISTTPWFKMLPIPARLKAAP